MDTLEAELEEYETQLLELNTYSNELTLKYNEKVEFQECLEKGRMFLAAEADVTSSKLDTANPLISAYSAPAISEDGMQPLRCLLLLCTRYRSTRLSQALLAGVFRMSLRVK